MNITITTNVQLGKVMVEHQTLIILNNEPPCHTWVAFPWGEVLQPVVEAAVREAVLQEWKAKQPFSGEIDEVAVHDHPLRGDDIALRTEEATGD